MGAGRLGRIGGSTRQRASSRQVAMLARSAASAARSFSRKVAAAAPRDSASSPSAPVPAKASSTRAPSTPLPAGPGRVPQHVEQRLPHPVGGRAGGLAGGRDEAAAAMRPAMMRKESGGLGRALVRLVGDPCGSRPRRGAVGAGIGLHLAQPLLRRRSVFRPSWSRSTFGFTSSTAPRGRAPSWKGP